MHPSEKQRENVPRDKLECQVRSAEGTLLGVTATGEGNCKSCSSTVPDRVTVSSSER